MKRPWKACALLTGIAALVALWLAHVLFTNILSEFRRTTDGDHQVTATPFSIEPIEAAKQLQIGFHLTNGTETGLIVPLFFDKAPKIPPRIVLERANRPVGYGCRWESDPSKGFLPGGRVRIELGRNWKQCSWSHVPWVLSVSGDAPSSTAIWGYEADSVPELRAGMRIVVLDPSTQPGTQLNFEGARRFLRAQWVYGRNRPPSETRFELLNGLWSHANSLSPQAALALGTCAFFLAMAVAALVRRRSLFPWCVGALAVCWTFLNPPLQAPDEPDHVLSFFRVFDSAREETLRQDLALDAKRTHFERIKFYEQESYNAGYAKVPFPSAWGHHVRSYLPEDRGPLWALSLRTLGLIDSAFPPRRGDGFLWVFLLRLANAVLITLTCLLVVRQKHRGDFLSLVPILVGAPVLFFATHASNYGFLISGTVLLLSAAARPSAGSAETRRRALLAGVGAALCVLSGRNGFLPLAFLPLLALTRAFEGAHSDPVPPWRNRLTFWGLVVAPSLACVAVLPSAFFGYVASFVGNRLSAETALAGKVLVAGILLAAVTLSAACETLAIRLRRPLAPRLVSFVLCAMLIVLAVVSASYKMPPLADIELSRGEGNPLYVLDVVPRFLLNLGFHNPDPYLSQSFWSGFGWLDVSLPKRLLKVLKFVPFAALLGLAALGWQRPLAARRVAFLFGGLAASMVVLFAQASFAAREGLNLHGRYLVVVFLGVLFSTLIPLCEECLERKRLSKVPLVLFVSGVCLQFYCLSVVLERYFA